MVKQQVNTNTDRKRSIYLCFVQCHCQSLKTVQYQMMGLLMNNEFVRKWKQSWPIMRYHPSRWVTVRSHTLPHFPALIPGWVTTVVTVMSRGKKPKWISSGSGDCLTPLTVTVMVNSINPLNANLNPICHLLALLGAHHILRVSRIRVKSIHLSIHSSLEKKE